MVRNGRAESNFASAIRREPSAAGGKSRRLRGEVALVCAIQWTVGVSRLVCRRGQPPLDIENDRPKSRRILPGTEVDVHCVNELKGRSSGYLFAIISSGYVIS